MTAVPAGETGSAGPVCEIRELSFWQALEILDADFRASSARELTGGGSPALARVGGRAADSTSSASWVTAASPAHALRALFASRYRNLARP